MANIRERTCLIIKREGKYLVALTSMTREIRWSENAYDAWQTRNIQHARMVAEKFNGELYLFNPIIGKIRKAKV